MTTRLEVKGAAKKASSAVIKPKDDIPLSTFNMQSTLKAEVEKNVVHLCYCFLSETYAWKFSLHSNVRFLASCWQGFENPGLLHILSETKKTRVK